MDRAVAGAQAPSWPQPARSALLLLGQLPAQAATKRRRALRESSHASASNRLGITNGQHVRKGLSTIRSHAHAGHISGEWMGVVGGGLGSHQLPAEGRACLPQSAPVGTWGTSPLGHCAAWSGSCHPRPTSLYRGSGRSTAYQYKSVALEGETGTCERGMSSQVVDQRQPPDDPPRTAVSMPVPHACPRAMSKKH
jgi:hypothetical protein